MESEKYELIYKIDRNEIDIRLLGEKFCKRNKIFSKIIYNNKKLPLIDTIEIKNIKEENKFKIYVIFYKIILNKSFMFKDCKSLLRISQLKDKKRTYLLKKEKLSEINEEEERKKKLFDYYDEDEFSKNSLYQALNDTEYLQDYTLISEREQEESDFSTLSYFHNIILKQNDENKNYSFLLNGMFFNCSSLLSIPDISIWKIDNVTNISRIFYNCSSLLSIPDISKWNTENVIDMSALFYNCSSLISLPDISKWNTKNVMNMTRIFIIVNH